MATVDLSAFWKLLGLGIEADFEKRTWSILAGPFKASGIKFFTLKSLSKDTALVQRLLSDLFVKPAVMWMDFRSEIVTDCISSLKALEAATGAASDALSKSHKEQDSLLGGLLLAWSGECKNARGRLEAALEDERDPANTGMDVSARAEIVSALGELRRDVYPTIKLLIGLLPDENPIKAQAVERLRTGQDDLVRHYDIGTASLVEPTLEPE